MLAMDINQRTSEVFEYPQRAQAAVHVYPMATGTGENPLENQVGFSCADEVLRPHVFEEGMAGG